MYKGKNSNNDSNEIGLSLAKAIIEKDNGRVIMNSLKGKGTTLCLIWHKKQKWDIFASFLERSV